MRAVSQRAPAGQTAPGRLKTAGYCLALLAIAAGVTLVLRSGPENPDSMRGTPPLAEIDGAESIIIRQNGQKLWEFAARKISFAADHSRATAFGLTNGTLYRNGAPVWKLSAGKATVDEVTRDVDADGGISANGPNGLNLATQRAVWQPRSGRIVCPQPLTARFRGLGVTAGSASYDMKRDTLNCAGRVTVTSRVAQLTSPAVIAHPKTGLVSFVGGVDIVVHPRFLTQWPNGIYEKQP